MRQMRRYPQYRSVLRAFVVIGLLSWAPGMALAATPISYRRTIRDASGVRHRVDFQGSADRGGLVGVITFDGRTVDVSAQIGRDGSLSGKLSDRSTGEEGSFWGTLNDAKVFGGRFNIGERVGDWTAPELAIPVDALPTSDEVTIREQ